MYYHYDAMGNVMDLTDHLGQGVIKYRWDVFGGMFAGTLAPYSYMGISGKEYDPKTGLIFFGSRWYDPLAGRFTMPDSFVGRISLPQTLNRYAYALNNPVRFLDPTGHDVGIPGDSGGSDDSGGDGWSDVGAGPGWDGGTSGGGTSSSGGGGGSSPPPPPPEGGSIQVPAITSSGMDTSGQSAFVTLRLRYNSK